MSFVHPNWILSASVSETKNSLRVDLYSNNFSVNAPTHKRLYVKKNTVNGIRTEQQAIDIAIEKYGDELKLRSRGDWIISKAKEKYGDSEARKELFSAYCQKLKEQFGDHYAWKSKEAQDMIIKDLNIDDMSDLSNQTANETTGEIENNQNNP